jgi:TatD DNase family protein
MRLIDTHCHLDSSPLADRVDDVLARARAAAVTKVVVPAYDTGSWAPIARLAATHEHVYPAFGLHPWASEQPLDEARLRAELQRHDAVAVGEIGLDYKIDACDRPRQREVFTVQLQLAADLDLPVILHCRGAFEDLFAILRERTGGVRGVLHAYSRGLELARRGLDLGLQLGFGGAVTRPRAKRVRRTAREVPLDRVVLETDAPSIGLDGIQPEQTEPCHVHDVAVALAELRGDSLARIAEVTTNNARELFRI